VKLGFLLLMGLGIHHWTLAEHLVCTVKEVLLSGGDLRGVELVALGQFTERFTLFPFCPLV